MLLLTLKHPPPPYTHTHTHCRFFLHPSYHPHDIIVISKPPFHLTKLGWGEFPIRVQLEFADNYNKPADIIHNLMLDRTHTGHQTLGAETVVDLDLSVVTDIGQYPNVNCTRWLLYNVNACVSSYVHDMYM